MSVTAEKIKSKVLIVEKVCATPPSILESFAFTDPFYVVDLEEYANQCVRQCSMHHAISSVDFSEGKLNISSFQLVGKHNLYSAQLAMMQQMRNDGFVPKPILH